MKETARRGEGIKGIEASTENGSLILPLSPINPQFMRKDYADDYDL